MQISPITILPRYNASFKSDSSNNDERRRRTQSKIHEIPTPQHATVKRGERVHRRNPKEMRKRAAIFTLAGIAAGAIGGNIATDKMIKNKVLENPIPIIEHYSGAPQDLIYEWQINGMTIFPKLDQNAIVSYIGDYSQEQLKNIKKAQNELADVYYNANSGVVYAVLNKKATLTDVKATFGIRMSTDTSIERLNNFSDKATIGADINTAKLEKGTIIKFDKTDAGYKENFYSSLLAESQK